MPNSETITTLEFSVDEVQAMIADTVFKEHCIGFFGEELESVEFVIGDGEGYAGADPHDWHPGPPELKKVVISFTEYRGKATR